MQGHDVMNAPVFLFSRGLFWYWVGDSGMEAIGNEYKTGLAMFRVG